jgi:hypothetical protein
LVEELSRGRRQIESAVQFSRNFVEKEIFPFEHKLTKLEALLRNSIQKEISAFGNLPALDYLFSSSL